MSPFEFENWVVKRLNGRANKVQVGDKGIDGRIYPVGVTPRETGAGELALEESWYPIQVKKPCEPKSLRGIAAWRDDDGIRRLIQPFQG